MRHFRLKKQIIRSLIVFLAFILSVAPAFAIDQNTLKFYAKNNILYYDPSGTSCLPSSSASPVEGNTVKEVVWNYFVNEGLPASVIAGIMGNIEAESGFDPFMKGKSGYYYYGLFMMQEANFNYIKTKIDKAVGGEFWRFHNGYEYTEPAKTNDIEKIKIATVMELDFMTGKNLGSDLSFSNNETWYAANWQKNFVPNIKNVTNTSGENGAKSYAELFLIFIERAVPGGNSPIEDQKVRDIVCSNPTTKVSCGDLDKYQITKKRRDFAIENYKAFANNTTNSLGGSSDGSTVTIVGDSITYITHVGYNAFSNKLPSADITAQGSRTFQTGIDIIKDPSNESSYHHDKYGTPHTDILSSDLRQTVVFALGSNETTISENQINDVISTLGPERNIYFITNYVVPGSSYGGNDYTSNNQRFKEAAEKNSNVYLIDWASEASANHDKYISDGIHPTKEGAEAFASLIYNAINKSTATTICDPAGSGGPATPWDGEIPWYNQCGTDSEGRSYMETKVGSSGYPDSSGYIVCHSACGVFSMASILTVLSGKKIDPGDGLLDYIGKEGRFFASSKGKPYGLTNMGSHESYKKYVNEKLHQTMTYEVVSKNNYTESAYISYINNALRSGKLVWIVGNESPKHVNTPFSPGGHFVAIRGIDASGNWLVIDPNGTAGKNHTFNKTFSPSQMYQHAQTNGTAIIGIN